MTYDADNRLATFNGQAVSHDLDGNMTYGPLTNDTFVSYTYDARNRLVQVGGTGSTPSMGYYYDPTGNRVAMTNHSNGQVTRFVVNPNAKLSQVLIRIRPGVTNYYVYGLGLLYEVTETATNSYARYYHYDYRGSTVALTDHSGNVTDRFEYSAYGMLTYRTGNTDTPFLYNGRFGVQTDPNGLLYMRARYYNPYVCRFINPDPIGFAGGLNWYVFADGNPVNYLDPYGLCTVGETSWGWLSGLWSGTKGALGWAYDQVYSVGALLTAGLLTVSGYAVDIGGWAVAGDPFAGQSLHDWAAYYWRNRTPAASAGWYDAASPVYSVATLGSMFAVPGGQARSVVQSAGLLGKTSSAVAPLPAQIAATFRRGLYRSRVLQTDVIAYRYSGGISQPVGRFLTTEQTVRQISTPQDAINLLNLPPGATAEQLNAFKIPKGTRIYYGRVEGGGEKATQIFIEDPSVLIPVP